MSSDIKTIHPLKKLEQALEIMKKYKIKKLPVVSDPTFRTLAKYFQLFFIVFSITTNELHDFISSQGIYTIPSHPFFPILLPSIYIFVSVANTYNWINTGLPVFYPSSKLSQCP